MTKTSNKILTLRNKHWSKRINKKTYYFGKEYDAALMRYYRDRPFLEAGVEPPSDGQGATVGELLNAFLSDRMERREKGRFARQTYEGYEEVCDVIAATLQTEPPAYILKSELFQVLRQFRETRKSGKQLCAKTNGGRLGYTRAIYNFASSDNLLIDRILLLGTRLCKYRQLLEPILVQWCHWDFRKPFRQSHVLKFGLNSVQASLKKHLSK